MANNNRIAQFTITVDEYELHILQEALRTHRHNLRIQREDILEATPRTEFSANNPDLADVDEWLARTAILTNMVGQQLL